jgi:hypothetical protein
MKVDVENNENGITTVILAGSIDINGALKIDSHFK